MDRNSIIGFVLLVLLLAGYIIYNQQSQSQYLAQKQADSIANAKVHPKVLTDTLKHIIAAEATDTTVQAPTVFRGVEESIVLENGDLALTVSTKGASVKAAQIKAYQTYDKQPLFLFNGADNGFSIDLPSQFNGAATEDLYFNVVSQDAKHVQLQAQLAANQTITVSYQMPDTGYMVDANITFNGLQASGMPIKWQLFGQHTEKDLQNELRNTQLYYQYADGDDDYYTLSEDKKLRLEKPVKWLGYRQLYFSTAIISKQSFDAVDVHTNPKVNADSTIITQNSFVLNPAITANANVQSVDFNWYIGPNDYHILKSYNVGVEDMVPYGYGVFAFVKYINKWIISPIFNFLTSFVGNMGLVIILLTLIIRLLLSFFTYKSYLSSAKMRMLMPEISALKEKYADNQQQLGMEQMKLYKTAGVNPLGGCLPSLLQLPILVALFYFIPTAIEFRGVPFLWADDLSTYDSIYNFPGGFSIPFYGNHVSLFTLLMTATSMFLAFYNRNMMAEQNNPVMKYMPFIFPIMLIGIFNGMAAALTFYYFVSNVFSILQQWVIQKFIIDEEKIKAKIEENKNKPAVPSKWQQKLEEMQKMQQERLKQQPIKKK